MRFIPTLAALMLGSGALAGGQHAGHHAYSFGEPGKAAEASRLVGMLSPLAAAAAGPLGREPDQARLNPADRL